LTEQAKIDVVVRGAAKGFDRVQKMWMHSWERGGVGQGARPSALQGIDRGTTRITSSPVSLTNRSRARAGSARGSLVGPAVVPACGGGAGVGQPRLGWGEERG